MKMNDQIAKLAFDSNLDKTKHGLRERRGDCSLILARVYGGEREERRREEEEGRRVTLQIIL